MAKKTYKTFSLKGLSLHLFDEWGRTIDVTFRGGIQIDSTAKFSTNDEKVQKALESCSGFGRDYYLESVKEEVAPVVEKPKAEPKGKEEPAPLTDVKDIKRFKNLIEMREAIKALGIDIPDNCTYLEAKSAAQKAGYDYQIQK